jgi:hypothetical protein
MKHLILLLVTSISLAQSPWTREKGKSFVQLGLTSLSYDSFQFDNKKIDNLGKFSDLTFQVYAEYGITQKLEAQLILPYKVISFDNAITNTTANISGLGNVSLGLKYKLYDKAWKISSGIMYNARSIKIDGANDLSTGFNAATILPYVSVGTSINKWYYFGNIGYGYMNNDYSDYLKATFEVGYEVIKNGHLIFVLDTRNVISKEDAFKNDTAQWASYLDRQTYNAIGLKANYEFTKDKFGANFAAIGATGIENAPLAPTLNLGIYAKL